MNAPNFRDELNPYEAPNDIVRAELVNQKQVKVVKRRPLLAFVLLIFNAPVSIVCALFWLSILGVFGPPPQPYAPGVYAPMVFFSFIFSSLWWLAGFICVKELVQAARGR